MKKIFSIILVIATIHCQAQADYDSLKQKILKTDIAINTIHSNIPQSHKGFQVGTIMIIAGVIVTSVGIQVMSNKAINGIHMIYGGLALTIAGYDIRQAHKWIGRGGRKSK